MARNKYKHETPEIAKKFVREPSVMVEGFLISQGDTFKVRGEYGGKFKFHSFVTNSVSGAQWVDCFELISGTPSVFRSFKLDRIKTIPKRGKRRKRVV
jgi:hypothetical protein